MAQDLKKLEIKLHVASENNKIERNGEFTSTRIKKSFISAEQRMKNLFNLIYMHMDNTSFLDSLRLFFDDAIKILSLQQYTIKMDCTHFNIGKIENLEKRNFAIAEDQINKTVTLYSGLE